tara:strand:+ start:46 stop:384 length:339 start_codon:yes stop_codon:yes gene_type:complete
LTKTLSNIISKELKIFYFKSFRRRSKSLETLDLIKECYRDQINLFNDHIDDLLNSFKKNESKSLTIESLKKIKNFEGCNKKIIKFLVAELKKLNDSIDFESEEMQFLFEFED